MANVVSIIQRVEEALEDTFQTRGAPDDEMHMAVGLTTLRDNEGDTASAAHIFISVVGTGDVDETNATLMVGLHRLIDDLSVLAMADGVWDVISARRIEKTMGAQINEAMGVVLDGDDADD